MSVKNIYDVLCKRMKREFYIAIALLGTFLFVSCQKDELSGKMYRGYYDPLQHMLIVFKDNSKVKAHMSSAEVIGFFLMMFTAITFIGLRILTLYGRNTHEGIAFIICILRYQFQILSVSMKA